MDGTKGHLQLLMLGNLKARSLLESPVEPLHIIRVPAEATVKRLIR